MPFRFKKGATPNASSIESPFVGPIDHTVGILVNLANLTNKEIDDYGWVKPGIPLNKSGALVTSGAVFGVTVESIKVADDNASATIAALGSVTLAVATIAQVNQDITEDILERALTAAELTGFAAAGCRVVLL